MKNLLKNEARKYGPLKKKTFWIKKNLGLQYKYFEYLLEFSLEINKNTPTNYTFFQNINIFWR